MHSPESKGRSWRCRIGWHKWGKAFNEDNEMYVVCRSCGKAAGETMVLPVT